MKQYSWENNQDVILLGLRNAGLFMKENAQHQQYLNSLEMIKMQKFGSLVLSKFEKCQESHLSDFYNVLLELK